MRSFIIAALTSAIALLAGTPVSAQTAPVTGRLLDGATRTPITAGVVQIANTKQRVLTDSLGRFAFSDVPVGMYALVASALGYRQTVASASTGSPVVILMAPEPVPLEAVVALAHRRQPGMRGASVRVFGRADLLAAGDMPIAQFVSWKAHFITRPCHVAQTVMVPMEWMSEADPAPDLAEVPPDARMVPIEWMSQECIIGPRGIFAPVRVMLDGRPLRYSSELWSQNTWDLGRVEVVYQYAGSGNPFGASVFVPSAFVRMYSLEYLARTAARVSNVCDHVSSVDTIGDPHLAALCPP